MIPKPFEYFVMPFYAFGNPGVAGYGKVAYNIIPYDNFIRMATISFEGTQFGAPGNQDYHNLKAGLEICFRDKNMNNQLTQMVFGRYIAASDLFQIESGAYAGKKAVMRSYQQFGYRLEKSGYINPFNLSASFESGRSYLKSSLEFNYKFSYYGKKNGLDIRLFAGKMLKNNLNVPFYAFAASGRSGRELYLYQGTYPDRFSTFPTTFWSRQMTLSEGGLVSPVNGLLGYSRWLVSLSLASTLPGIAARLPVKPFVNILLNDHGTGNGHDSPLFYEAGFKAGIWDFFEIYIPLAVSGNIQSITGSLRDRVRFVFNLDTFTRVKLNSGVRIKIR